MKTAYSLYETSLTLFNLLLQD